MKNEEIFTRFKATVDQFYKETPRDYIEKVQIYFIGGILQSALHILPNEKYFELKCYIYEAHGYDPGGVAMEKRVSGGKESEAAYGTG